MLVALAAVCLTWLPRCEAATRALAKERLLLRRLRGQRTEPFIVSFRVTIEGGEDNVELAKNLSTRINTAGTPEAGTMRYSVARVFNGTFPPVEWQPSTTVGPMRGAGKMAPEPCDTGGPAVPVTTPKATAMQTAMEALRIAEENQLTYDKLTKKMTRATIAHANALVYGNPEGTTPLPTPRPFSRAAKEESNKGQLPHTLGRLVYDAFVGTPAPMEFTTPAPTAAVPLMEVVSDTTGRPCPDR